MTTKDEALIELIEDLLEQIERVDDHGPRKKLVQRGIAAITAIKQAITSGNGQAQEPVASIYISAMGREFDDWKCELPEGRNLLYAAPKQAEPIQPSSQKTLALAQEGMDLHDHNAPEYIICAELMRLNKALAAAPTPPEAK